MTDLDLIRTWIVQHGNMQVIETFAREEQLLQPVYLADPSENEQSLTAENADSGLFLNSRLLNVLSKRAKIRNLLSMKIPMDNSYNISSASLASSTPLPSTSSYLASEHFDVVKQILQNLEPNILETTPRLDFELHYAQILCQIIERQLSTKRQPGKAMIKCNAETAEFLQVAIGKIRTKLTPFAEHSIHLLNEIENLLAYLLYMESDQKGITSVVPQHYNLDYQCQVLKRKVDKLNWAIDQELVR